MNREFQVVHVKADTPKERGRQYGEQAADKILAGVENYRQYFEKSRGAAKCGRAAVCNAPAYVIFK